ncbi:phosphatidate cytidylyltransferase [Sphingomonas gilva]|uniref:Phosphatidate cytidylyltransferase n=2 Tax=Sphingomonas gilva TaxID=2305907 RepID=A0A396RK05_9SPHN|nr:phosphatidate cytidylyltransferase [Sphingomonas gilva]RHW16538.1 phosphatidate cytidylyltransferase [Sphingomonas gilva]
MADLPRKTLVAAILIALALTALMLGGVALWLLAVIAGLLMMAEWADLARVEPKQKRIALFALSVPLAILSPLAAGPDFFAMGLIAGAAFFVAAVTRQGQLALGVAYVGVPVAALLAIRNLPDGAMLAFWSLAIVWATDIGAYFAGRLIGGPKLMPRLSPNKTWAGLGGGMVAAWLTGMAFSTYGGLDLRLALLSPLLAIVAQAGDLYESGLKRKAGVKDSGTILPGHGGVLDRLDGVVTVAPIAFILILIADHFA